jgi:hypothetical protein
MTDKSAATDKSQEQSSQPQQISEAQPSQPPKPKAPPITTTSKPMYTIEHSESEDSVIKFVEAQPQDPKAQD